ncbi:MAG: calcium/sodium antiporter [Candidatus Longimicrobiales bacterium M2_2A_002]
MYLNALYFVIGLLGLYLGAEWLVGGAARVARRLGTRPLVIGLTVVAFGSSAPELLVGVVASAQNQSDVVMGNVLGSNILNIALILGMAAIARPLRVGMRLLSREGPLMVVASLLVAAMMLDGVVGRVDALILLAGFLAFLAFVLRAAESEPEEIAAEYVQFETEERGPSDGGMGRDLLLILLGLAGLIVGAQLLVMSAVFFARLVGVTEVVIGLTVVAIGTSLPELATCVVAALRDESDIALGNAVGSNIFNLLSILGVSAMIRPISVAPGLMEFEVPAMILFAVLLVPLAWHGRLLGRISGSVLVGGYVVFTAILIARSLP